MKKVSCHHGSPGTTSDFLALEDGLASAGVQLAPVERKNAFVGQPGFQLGYSWGANLALEACNGRADCTGVILVSPYFSAAKKRGALYFLFLNLILRISPLRKKIIKSFLAKTAAPIDVPKSYEELQTSLEKKLYTAVKEKSNFTGSASKILEKCSPVPLLVIMGENDAVSNATEIQLLLKKYSPQAEVIVLKNAGHALLWTHSQELVSAIAKFVEKHFRGEN